MKNRNNERLKEATRRRFLANLDAMVGRRYADLDEHRLYIANAGMHNRLIQVVDGVIKRTGGGHETEHRTNRNIALGMPADVETETATPTDDRLAPATAAR